MANGRKRLREPEIESTGRITRDDIICPICLEIWKEVYVTVCGHSFCYRCISQALTQARRCPVCQTSLPEQSAMHPNYSLNCVVAKYHQQASAERELAMHVHVPGIDELLKLADKIAPQDRHRLLTAIQQKVTKQEEQEKVYNSAVLLDFLHRARQCKRQELATVQKQLVALEEDCSTVEAKLAPGGHEQAIPTSPCPSLPLQQEELSSSEASSSSQQVVAPDPVTPADLAAAEVLSERKLRVHSNFDDILQNYLEASSGPLGDPADRLGEFAESLEKFTTLASFRELSALTYGDQSPSSGSIISSIEFDKDGEFFAIARVTRKIKVFD